MQINSNSIHFGDCLDIMPSIPDEAVDAIITDPPYELGFMGKGWDKSGIAFNIAVWKECLRILKPGGYLIAFGGTRTYHRLACAIEDAGFEIRDMIEWVYRSGFAKSMSIDKAIDAAAGAEREVIGHEIRSSGRQFAEGHSGFAKGEIKITAPATEAARQWEGYGTGLKPAHEPMVLAMKPLSEKTFVENVLKYGTGALNIDGCRIPTDEEVSHSTTPPINSDGIYGKRPWMYDEEKRKKVMERKEERNEKTRELGRFPANVAVTDDALNKGEITASSGNYIRKGGVSNGIYGKYLPCDTYGYTDSGSPSRYFDIDRWAETNGILQFTKPPQSERHEGCEDLEKSGVEITGRQPDSAGIKNPRAGTGRNGAGNFHPTVKPISLLAWLVTLITKPGDLILDPFGGSGSTARACIRMQRKYILIEKEAEYVEIARRRIKVELEQPWLFEFEK